MKLEYVSPALEILLIEENAILLAGSGSVTSGRLADGTPTEKEDGGAVISTIVKTVTGDEDDDDDPFTDGAVRSKSGITWDEW